MRIKRQIGLLFLGAGIWIGNCTMNLAGRIKRNERGDVPGWVMITLMTRTWFHAYGCLLNAQKKPGNS